MLAENTLLVRYAVTGGNAVYAVPFRVYRPEDVAVTWSADGRTESALALGKDYSVRVLATGGAELRLEAGVVGGVGGGKGSKQPLRGQRGDIGQHLFLQAVVAC